MIICANFSWGCYAVSDIPDTAEPMSARDFIDALPTIGLGEICADIDVNSVEWAELMRDYAVDFLSNK